MDPAPATRIEEIDKESADLDFKSGFDPAAAQDWCELVKDIVAMANSGGGLVVFGVNDDGTPAKGDLKPLLAVDPRQGVPRLLPVRLGGWPKPRCRVRIATPEFTAADARRVPDCTRYGSEPLRSGAGTALVVTRPLASPNKAMKRPTVESEQGARRQPSQHLVPVHDEYLRERATCERPRDCPKH